MGVIDIIQIILVVVLVIFGVYYFYTSFFGNEYQPKLWKALAKKGYINKELQKAESSYKDHDRFFNFWFQTERIKRSNIEGAIAELGVYKGDTAYILHQMDPQRDIHLFDTFEGFQQKDLDTETGKAATYTTHNFADTSIERVMQRLSSEKFIFHKGYFPDTTEGLNDIKYALVSMDADLYNPTKAGLEYFYPRLSPGGVILVHDYNPDWPGIMKAVNEYCERNNIILVPLTDKDNTVMIFKPVS